MEGTKFKKCSSPMFQQCFRSNQPPCIVLMAKISNQQAYTHKNVCPCVQVSQQQSVIQLSGECLEDYLRKSNNKECVLPEDEIWNLLLSLTQAYIFLHGKGLEPNHVKQYCVQRISSQHFTLIYHEKMIPQLKAAKSTLYNWYDFYLSPEELLQNQFVSEKSIVFSTSAMILSICTFQDSVRNMYRQDRCEVDWKRVREKFTMLRLVYSEELEEVLRMGLQANPQQRASFHQFYTVLAQKNRKIARKKETLLEHVMKSCGTPVDVSYKLNFLSLNKSQKLFSFRQKPETEHGFQYRGTFGGREEEEEDKEAQEQTVRKKKQIQEQYDMIETPRGFQTLDNQLLDPIEHISELSQQFNEEEIFEQTMKERVYEMVIPQKLFRFKELSLEQCLKPRQQLIKKIGKVGIFIEGDIYYGQTINGRRHGFGLEIFPNDEYFYGNFKQDLFEGTGFYFWNKSEYFLGEFRMGQKIRGILEGRVKYQGELLNSLRNGKGTCWYPSGQIYAGEWLNGKKHGEGVLIKGNWQFRGSWHKGKRKGKGQLKTEEMIIDGTWQNEETIGQAQVKYNNGDKFTGVLGSSFEKLKGQYSSKSGTFFKGRFQNDEPSQGELRYSNGEKYIGSLVNMKRNGYGEYYYNNNEIYRGYWQMNKKTS